MQMGKPATRGYLEVDFTAAVEAERIVSLRVTDMWHSDKHWLKEFNFLQENIHKSKKWAIVISIDNWLNIKVLYEKNK